MIDCDANGKEILHHRSAIEMLSQDFGIPVDQIGALYNKVLKELRRTAKVTDYLPILVCRRVRDLLQEKKAA